jgi:mono/diheme cytochrome c family protein
MLHQQSIRSRIKLRMNVHSRIALGAIGAALLAAAPNSNAASLEDFDQRIAPILSRSCGQCHNDTNRASGFSVAGLESVLRGGARHGAAVVAGHPEQSPLVRVLTGELAPKMPLGGNLPEEDVKSIAAWVRELDPKITERSGEEAWPFAPPVKAPPPAVKNREWVRNPIDAFVLAKLEEKDIAPAPQADKRTLARRLYIDLIGLPPRPEELAAFLGDQSPDAYESLVEKLLADPRYGERWGRHWLDLVRYGETSGLEGDGAIGNAWRYRDWVVRALNEDMPYDEFVLQQIAGADEHSQTRNNYVPDAQGYIPAGFLRLAPWDRSNLVAAEVRQNYLNEVTTATSSIFLGLTMGCARCHDHKYDPIPTKDFYRMQAFFNAVQTEDRQGAVDRPEVPYADPAFAARAAEKIKEYEGRIKEGPEKKALDELEKKMLAQLVALRRKESQGKELTNKDLRLELRRKDGQIFNAAEIRLHAQLLEDADRTLDPEERQALDAYEKHLMAKMKEAYAAGKGDPEGRFEAITIDEMRGAVDDQYAGEKPFTDEEIDRHAELTGQLDVFRRRLSRWQPIVLTVRNAPGPPSGPPPDPVHVLGRGDYRQPGEAVEPGFPSAITGNMEPAELYTDRYRQFPTRGLRYTLARWIASPDNPLTARVMANRIWQYHFGRGIVETSSNFGKNGAPPTHPELLDWLAVAFVERGWSVKEMHRLMLLSATYRQSSENPAAPENESLDADNRLLWRFERRRLEAEAIRDGILYLSGGLNPEREGPSVFPPLPEDLADFARYGRTGGLMWEPNEKDQDARRRSIYIFQRRSLPLPMMAAFDANAFSESCERRSETTTPLQALSMLNGYLVHEEADRLAATIAEQVGAEPEPQIRQAFEVILGRSPEDQELAQFKRFEGSLAAMCRVLFNSNEFLYME